MRFCTSLLLSTSTASTRFSDSGTNSIWVIEDCWALGSVTTPASCVMLESSCEAVATSALESCPPSSWRRNSLTESGSIGCTRSSVSTKKR